MARANNNGWDFIEKGKIYQYLEGEHIFIVEVLKDISTSSEYSFLIKPIAATINISESFLVTSNKNLKGYYNGMAQFYENVEYLPFPIGSPYPFIFDEEKLGNSKFHLGEKE